MIQAYIGVDVGSVSTNIAIIDSSNAVLASAYIRTHGILMGADAVKNEITAHA